MSVVRGGADLSNALAIVAYLSRQLDGIALSIREFRVKTSRGTLAPAIAYLMQPSEAV